MKRMILDYEIGWNDENYFNKYRNDVASEE